MYRRVVPCVVCIVLHYLRAFRFCFKMYLYLQCHVEELTMNDAGGVRVHAQGSLLFVVHVVDERVTLRH